MSDIFETAGHRTKQTKIGASGVSTYLVYIPDTFDC